MGDYSSKPSFREASLFEPLMEFALLMIASRNEVFYGSGTAILIGYQLAIAAKHVLDDYWMKFEKRKIQSGNVQFKIHIPQFLRRGKEVHAAMWDVKKVWCSPHTDVAFLFLTAANQNAADYKFRPRLTMNLFPPSVGSEVVGFGYAKPKVENLGDVINCKPSPVFTFGKVIEVYDESRDSSMLNFPCFRTDARFAHSMSGGPVFNEQRELCGVICSCMDPCSDADDYISYVATLWPMMLTQLDLKLKDGPSSYPVLELARLGHISALGWERVHYKG